MSAEVSIVAHIGLGVSAADDSDEDDDICFWSIFTTVGTETTFILTSAPVWLWVCFPAGLRSSYSCSVCSVVLNSIEQYHAHLQGSKHQNKWVQYISVC